MITVNQIREQLIDLLKSKSPSTLEEFDEWICLASWNMNKDSDPKAQQFASAIELRLAEYGNGYMNKKQLYDELKELLARFSVQMSIRPTTIVSGTNSHVHQLP